MVSGKLIFPYAWPERRPLVHQGVLFAPACFAMEDRQAFAELFARTKVYVECCSGHGHWIIAKAKQYPDIHWVAIEKRFDRVKKIWAKQQQAQLDNLQIVCGDARQVIASYLPCHSVAKCFVNFPDPWPKARHAKHRLITASWLATLAEVMEPEGEFICVTDDVAYRDQVIAVTAQHPQWQTLLPAPHFQTLDDTAHGWSWFLQLWRERQRAIYQIQGKVL